MTIALPIVKRIFATLLQGGLPPVRGPRLADRSPGGGA
ncbi:MAG: hypothetical protein RJA48_965 [Verrucomicrobiota bacterium]